MLKSSTLVLGPVLCGALYFWWAAAPQRPGVYVETIEGTTRLPDCDPGAHFGTALSGSAPVWSREVTSFFVVTGDGVQPADAAAAKLQWRLIDHGAPDQPYPVAPVATQTYRLSSTVYRIKSDRPLRWDTAGSAGVALRAGLAAVHGNRATTDVLLELELPAHGAAPCRSGIVLGPPPNLPELPAAPFVPVDPRR